MKIETTLRQAAQQALEAYDKHEPLAVVMEELRAALEQPEDAPLTNEQRMEVLRTAKFRDWFVAGSRGAASRAAEVAHDIKETP